MDIADEIHMEIDHIHRVLVPPKPNGPLQGCVFEAPLLQDKRGSYASC